MHFSIFLRLSSHPLKMGEFSRRIFINSIRSLNRFIALDSILERNFLQPLTKI